MQRFGPELNCLVGRQIRKYWPSFVVAYARSQCLRLRLEYIVEIRIFRCCETTLLRDEKYSLNLLTNVLRSAPVSVRLVSAISWMSLPAQCNKIARCRPPALMPFAAKYMRTVFTYFSHLRDTPFG